MFIRKLLTYNLRNLYRTIRPLAVVSIGFSLPFSSTAFAAHDMTMPQSSSPDASLEASSASSMEEGKMLFENGQYMAALGKFMNVLRHDSTDPEARKYLRRVIDAMRQTAPGAANKKALMPTSDSVSDEEMQQMLEKRSRLTLDLKAIPGLKIIIDGNTTQVVIETSILFADKTGGLREQGVPMLDRVAAWLGTFGQQPVIVHCYPEEMQDPATNGSLFLHRYSELYNFFVDERKMAPQRFVSADLLSEDESKAADANSATKTPHVIIETVGSQAAFEEDLPANIPRHPKSSWIEFSIYSSRSKSFNPEEGEWASLDLSALTRAGLSSWRLVILPMTKEGPSKTPVYTLQGKGNLLMRMSWDGHDEKSGSFAPSGHYLARLVAIDADGTRMTQEMKLQVRHGSSQESADVIVSRPARHHSKPKKATPKVVETPSAVTSQTATAPPPPPSPLPPVPATGNADTSSASPSDSLIGNSKPASSDDATTTPPVTPASTDAAPAASDDTSDSTHAIWVKVIQFETDSSTLAPTSKAALGNIKTTLDVYPLQKVRILGFAVTSEADASNLAKQRAETVRTILVNEYHVDRKRVSMAGGKTSSDPSASKVELSITN